MDVATKLPQMRYCCVQSCINSKGTTSDKFHFFEPSMEKHILEKWTEAISQHQNIQNITHVCNLHFEPESLIQMDNQLFLKHGSIPSIFSSNQTPESNIQTEEVSVKMEPMSIEGPEIIQLVNINEILQSASTPKNEPTSDLRQYNDVGPAMCNGCFNRDAENQLLLAKMDELKVELHYWKSLAMQYIPENVKLPEGSEISTRKSPTIYEAIQTVNPTAIPTELIKYEENPTEYMNIYETDTMEEHTEPTIEATMIEEDTIEITDDEEMNIEVNKLAVKVTNHLRKPYKCGKCDKILKTPGELALHIEEHMQASKICIVCRVSYNEGQMDQHLCIEGEFISCEHCPQTYSTTKQLLEHLESTHNDVQLHRCSRCCQPFRMMFLKNIHKRYHDTSKPFKCNMCLKSFPVQESLIRHRKKEHINPKANREPKSKRDPNLKSMPESKPRFLCDHCGKEFSRQGKLSQHLVSHRERKYKCPHCPYIGRYQRDVERHGYVHSHSICVCSICGAKYSSPENLRGHMISHSKIGPFECEICSKKFKKKNYLTKHIMKVHVPSKGFQCKFCNNLYKYSGDLTKHLRTHLGDKIYECSECSERFRLHSELQKHSFTHYKEQQMTSKLTADE